MAFYLLFLCGVLGGFFGGMGMGGGTLLIPLLTLFCGIPQPVAQGLNLVSFLPMSLIALHVHAKNGLLSLKTLRTILPFVLAFSLLFSLLSVRLSGEILRRLFGAFLLLLALSSLAKLPRKK